jgi:hypothetical protein
MKQFFLPILCFIFSFSVSAQQEAKPIHQGKIGITFSSFGKNDIINSEPLIGGPNYIADGFYIFGINYVYKINNTFDFETGIEYAKHKIIIDPFDPPYDAAPSHGAQFSLINIPLTVRVNFLKYCFVNGGFNLDFDPTVSSPIDSQNGIGAILGLGIKYDTKYGISAFVNPYIKAHSLISFSSYDYRQRVLESGFRFGVMYKLK